MLKCTLDGTNAKILAKAIQSLSKFGTYLFVEGLQDGLHVRTVNNSKSAVATFKFKRTFFETYNASSSSGDDSYCKVSMKSCLTVFRNMKQVEQCEIQIIPTEGKFLVQFKSFKLETIKNTYITILDEENISAGFSNDAAINSICGSHKIFTELVGSFNASEEEITFEANKDSLTAKNYIEGSRVFDKFMRSQLKLSAMEFENYKIERETTITFSLKEFRALLVFAETLNENLVVSFDDCGSPMFINVKNLDDIDCLLVMSTLSYEDVSFYESCQRNDGIETYPSGNAAPKRKPQNTRNETSVSKVRCVTNDSTLSVSTIFPFNSGTTNSNQNSDMAIPRDIMEVNSSSLNMILTNNNAISPSREEQQGSAITFPNTNDMEIDVDDCVIESPTREKQRHEVRSIFSRCFQSTYIPTQPMPGSHLYVENSDTED